MCIGWRKGQQPEEERRLLSMFADDPEAPFSIHKFVEQGEQRDIRSGQWFGPTPTAQCIQCVPTSLNASMNWALAKA